MAAQLVAQGEAQARRGLQLFNIGDGTPPSSFLTAQSAAPLTQTTALAMGFTLSPEQQAQAAAMATAMDTEVDEPVAEPAPSSGVLVPANEIPPVPVEQRESW